MPLAPLRVSEAFQSSERRDFRGRWTASGLAKALREKGRATLPDGRAAKRTSGGFTVHNRAGREVSFHRDAKDAAKHLLNTSARSDHAASVGGTTKHTDFAAYERSTRNATKRAASATARSIPGARYRGRDGKMYVKVAGMHESAALIEAADSLRKASTPEPFSKSKTSNWVARAGGLPAYVQHIAHDLMEKRGKSESSAIQMAIGIVKRWAAGGGNVDATTRAAAQKAVGEWEAMKGKAKVQHSDEAPLLVDTFALREAALERIAVLDAAVGGAGLAELLAAGLLAEAAAFAPTLKRVASGREELERHELHDGGQHVGTISKRAGFRNEPARYSAAAINGDRLGDYAMGSQQAAVDAVKRHLEEAPARVTAHRDGKFLVARPGYGAGPMTYTEMPNEAAARYAAGLPSSPSTPEVNSKVHALGEMLRLDLQLLEGVDIPPLREVQAARRADPFELVEGFVSGELRDFKGRWRDGGHHAQLTPRGLSPRPRGAGGRPGPSVSAQRYEGGVVRASAKARAAHAAKPQIAPKQPKDGPKVLTLADAVGKGAWSPSAGKATGTLHAQRVLEGEDLVKAVAAGSATDTEHIHRLRNADGSLGQYTPERLALHQRIIENMLQGKGVHEGSAQAIFTAGGPASGKSGIVKTGDSAFERAIGKDSTVQMPPDVVYADPDIVRTQLPEYQNLVKAGRSDASSLTHEEASFLAKQLTRIALGAQHHILVDTVGDSGPGKFRGKIEQAQRAGHKVSVHYATTDVGTALERAKERAKSTGRAVPEDYLRASHRDVSRRFSEDISKMKGIHLRVVDTTHRPNKVIAEQLPADDKLGIKDGELFRRFLLKGKG